MARPQRSRRVCSEPDYTLFVPDGRAATGAVLLTIDEYETIRLVDYERMTHEQCAARMDISRTTVTEIYERARHKIADAFVNGKRILITGGNYRLCSGAGECCCGPACTCGPGCRCRRRPVPVRAVAAADENGQISQCAGRDCASKLYTEQTCSTERDIRSAAHPDGCKKTENVKDGQR